MTGMTYCFSKTSEKTASGSPSTSVQRLQVFYKILQNSPTITTSDLY